MAKSDLNRAAIVARALDIADAEGLEAITVRRISREFGVTPMALYWHVKDKDELLDAMGDALFVDTDIPVDPGQDWSEQLGVLVDSLVRAFRRHPGAVRLAFTRVVANDAGRQLSEHVFDVLRTAGFGVRETADIGIYALRTAVMLVEGEPGRETAPTPEERDAVLAAKRAALKALPIEQFPRLHEMTDAMLDCDDEDDYYRFGIDTFLAGVRARQQSLTQSAV
jgi:TetR/AcrR family transcriptional regulator, tetracycline repressor protein